MSLKVIHKPGGYRGWEDEDKMSAPSWGPIIGCGVLFFGAALVFAIGAMIFTYSRKGETVALVETTAEVTPEITAESTLEATAETTPEITTEATPETTAEITANPVSAARITHFVPTAPPPTIEERQERPEVTNDYLPEIEYVATRIPATAAPQIVERVIPGERVVVTAPPVVVPGPEIRVVITSPPVQIIVTATFTPTETPTPTITPTPGCVVLPPDEGSPTATFTPTPYPYCITPTATLTQTPTATPTWIPTFTPTLTATYSPTALITFPPDETPEVTNVP